MEKAKLRNIFFRHSFTANILYLCFAVSVVSLIIYFSELNYDDSRLFLLLMVIRYTAFFVIVCAIYKLVFNIYRIIFKKQYINIIKMIIYLIFLIYGICAFLLEAIIVVVSRGNG